MNATGYELYGLIGEANGQALPLGFIFTAMMNGSAQKGARQCMLENFLEWFSKRNIKFTLSDNDFSEIGAFCKKIPVKHQLCYWHGVHYIKGQLAEDKPPAYYDPHKAHLVFSYLDATWALGITRGDIEEYFDSWDIEAGANIDGGVREHLQQMQDVSDLVRAVMCTGPDYLQTQILTTLPPLVIVKVGNCRLPIWPEPPSRSKADLPRFCPMEHRGTIVEKFRLHLHQHPEIPFNDVEGTHLTADEIHEGAVSDMYHYCHQHDLSQVWAYMWNCWYNPQQWPLWACSACAKFHT